jgi:hypothetical protein
VGLQQQVALNVLNCIAVAIRGFGAVGVLIWVSTIKSFFMWQVLIATLSLIVLMLITYRILPRAECGVEFSMQALKKMGTFAGA